MSAELALSYRQIKTPTKKEFARMVEVLSEAFLKYEPHVDMFGPSRKLMHRLEKATLKLNLRKHETWVAELDGEIVAVALWVRPGQEWIENSDILSVFGRVVLSIPFSTTKFLVLNLLPGLDAQHDTVSPHCAKEWMYLATFGVDPKMHGKGVGSAFLQHERERIDGPIGLDTQTEKNVVFYEKNGYKTLADKEWTLPNGKPYRNRFMVSGYEK